MLHELLHDGERASLHGALHILWGSAIPVKQQILTLGILLFGRTSTNMAYPYHNQHHGGYGGPPQSNYGAPPQTAYGSYGAAAPPQQYGAPPHHSYGAPAPYGAAPPHQHYGVAPPQHSYGHQTHGHNYAQAPYSASPASFYLGTPIPPPATHGPPLPPPHGFDVHGTVDRIRKATKGFGTDEKALIAVLAPLDAFQIDATSRQFKASVGKELLYVLEKETSGYFEGALRAKVLGPLGYDVWLVHRACSGAGTHEDLLNEVLLCRTNA